MIAAGFEPLYIGADAPSRSNRAASHPVERHRSAERRHPGLPRTWPAREPQWAGVIDKAVTAVNEALSNKGINVVIKLSKKESEAEATLDTVPGSDLHGQSLLDTGGTAYIQKVTIKVPATPRVSKLDPKAREACAFTSWRTSSFIRSG
jgi:hypothetical protein